MGSTTCVRTDLTCGNFGVWSPQPVADRATPSSNSLSHADMTTSSFSSVIDVSCDGQPPRSGMHIAHDGIDLTARQPDVVEDAVLERAENDARCPPHLPGDEPRPHSRDVTHHRAWHLLLRTKQTGLAGLRRSALRCGVAYESGRSDRCSD